ncbi:MAG: acetyl-CoA carboxylase, biotin carboxylase subunit [Gaiellaceae bacterium]|nr:acetyl-CoA carboxylase, biotin carboxylase subunit [Gaiellaceae bacterium]
MAAGISRVLIANRGEIAVRIVRACFDEGLETVLVVSDADRDSLAAQLADRVVCIGPPSATESYLDIGRLMAAATGTGCDALHPGYGFVSERPALSEACGEAGIAFVGPSPEAMRRSGDKAAARSIARSLGINVGVGSEIVATGDEAAAVAERIGFPLLLKAAGGGGGRGMRRVDEPGELRGAWTAASVEAQQAFGDGRLFVERFVRRARHVEVQILADRHGGVIHLGDRDCTLQRRYQKLIEEAPAPALPGGLEHEIRAAAVELIAAVGYEGAATCEFLIDQEAATYGFLEINARLQVEHPVSEMVTGIDIVREQLRIAGGERLSVTQDEVKLAGHSVEVRVNAESPQDDFMPTPGRLAAWTAPVGTDVRVDTACFPGWTIGPYYDSLLAKIVTRGPTREDAIATARHALQHLRVEGVQTTAGFASDLLAHPAVAAAQTHTRWIEEEFMPEWNAREARV